MSKQKWYWLAINGSSCAAWSVACERVEVSPTPEFLLGLSTRREQLEVQHILLNEPLEVARTKLQQLVALASAYQTVFIKPENHEPQTDGPTVWMEAD